jgi:hypothetical protein
VIQVALCLDSIPKNIDVFFGVWMKSSKNKSANMFLFGCGAVLGLFGEPEMIDALATNLYLIPQHHISLLLLVGFLGYSTEREGKKMVVQGSKLIRRTTSEVLG